MERPCSDEQSYYHALVRVSVQHSTAQHRSRDRANNSAVNACGQPTTEPLVGELPKDTTHFVGVVCAAARAVRVNVDG